MRRTLPTVEETARILSRRRPRPAPPSTPTAGKALAKTVKGLESRFGQGDDVLKGRWRDIVGDELARRTEPTKLLKAPAGPKSPDRAAGGATLELRVEGPSAAIIQHRARDILERVNLFLGGQTVTRLRIVQGPLRGASKRKSRPQAPGRRTLAPLDAGAEAVIAAGLAAMPEGRLKAALARLGREVSRSAAPEVRLAPKPDFGPQPALGAVNRDRDQG